MTKLSKKALTERCREILYGSQEVVNEDFEFMMGILSRHSDADKKIGCGVKRMWSDRNPVYTHTRCFFIERLDGSVTDFSFTSCITKANDFKAACRNAIRPQIKAFRVSNNVPDDYHVDHDPESFNSILKRFVDIHGEGKVKENEDLEYGCFLVDKDYEQKWCNFHEQEAKLRAITAKDNLTKKRS